ncbi:hypothetical protein [Nocardia sp. NPDC002869]|uniref:hypothetical protein n=1 Tax=Nocardia sp. NPDC002869 TaxID=3161032 RepID=UPI00398D2E13
MSSSRPGPPPAPASRRSRRSRAERRRDLLIDLADAVHERMAEFSRLNVHDYGVPEPR